MLSEKTGVFANYALSSPFTLHRLLTFACAWYAKKNTYIENEALSDSWFVHSRYIVLPKDFEAGYKNNIKKDESEHEFYK